MEDRSSAAKRGEPVPDAVANALNQVDRMGVIERTWWITVCHECGELLDGTEPTDACKHEGRQGTIEVRSVDAAPGGVDTALRDLVAEAREVCVREGVEDVAGWIGKTVLARVGGQQETADVIKQSVTLRRCGTCGLFDPQVAGGEGLVTLPCAHRNWQEIEYVPAKQILDVLRLIIDADAGDWDRTIPTLAQWAETRLREFGRR